MQIKAGRFYITRSDRVIGPIRPNPEGREYHWCCDVDGRLQTWTDDGRWSTLVPESPLDLVRELEAEPKPPKQIDQMTLADYRRGVARTWCPALP
jgi:hypothetical protein